MDDDDQVEQLCKYCGQRIHLYEDKGRAWGHTPFGVVICRRPNGELLDPIRSAQPTTWRVAG